jgi:MoaA/NifB/PqqE/SkfB family radical SAM enzyme
MYNRNDYLQRGKVLVNNRLSPRHRKISTLMIYATDLCDSRCQHCLIWAKRPVKYLAKEKILSLMQNDCISRHTIVGLEGGEFLLHPEARDMMRWFHKNHPRFHLLSNCLKPDALIEAVKEAPPERLFISLDGTEETYKEMRGKDGYSSVLKVIENLKSVVPISVMYCVSPWNTMEDLQHVAEVCKHNGTDLRVGVYSNINLFDTKQEAYKEETDLVPPQILKEFSENYDYLLLYNEWRKGHVKMTCNSILDSCVIFPNGDVPICMNLELTLGNIFENTLDEIYAKAETVATLKHHHDHCNACFINFHRKYDIILYRTFEKYFPKAVVSKMFGYHQWNEDAGLNYNKAMQKITSR